MHNNDFWLESLSVCTEKVRKQVDSKCLQPSVKQCRLCHGLCISANGVRSCQNYWNYELRKAPSDLIHRAIPTGKYLSGNSLIMRKCLHIVCLCFMLMWLFSCGVYKCLTSTASQFPHREIDQSSNLNITEAAMMTENGTTGSKDVHTKYWLSKFLELYNMFICRCFNKPLHPFP